MNETKLIEKLKLIEALRLFLLSPLIVEVLTGLYI